MTFCVLGENCSVFDRQNECPGVSLYQPLCEGCRNRASSELNMLRYDYVDLSQHILKVDGPAEVKISRSKPESSPPLDVTVFTLRSDIAWHCVDADLRLRAALGEMLGTYQQTREGYGLDCAVRYLSPRVNELASMPAAGDRMSGLDYLVLFGQLHRRARRACGLDPRTVSLPGGCPQCLASTLRRHDDDADRIWCGRCGVTMNRQGYYAVTRMQFAPSCETP